MFSDSESKGDGIPLLSKSNTRRERWRSGCFTVDASFLRFFVCMLVSLLTVVAALLKLVTDGSCDTYGFWGPILSLIIGIWTPTPKKSTGKD